MDWFEFVLFWLEFIVLFRFFFIIRIEFFFCIGESDFEEFPMIFSPNQVIS